MSKGRKSPKSVATASAVIGVTHKLGVSLHTTVPKRMRTTTLGVTARGHQGTRFFASDGLCYHVARLDLPSPLGPLAHLLASTVYNPWLTAAVLYDTPTAFTCEELRDLLLRALEDDDDILTQWREKDEVKVMLSRARTFGHCVSTLRFAGLQFEEEPGFDHAN